MLRHGLTASVPIYSGSRPVDLEQIFSTEPGTWPPIKRCVSLELVVQRQNRCSHSLPLWAN